MKTFEQWFENYWSKHGIKFAGPPSGYERMAKAAWKARWENITEHGECDCPEGSLCGFFDSETDECLYGKI